MAEYMFTPAEIGDPTNQGVRAGYLSGRNTLDQSLDELERNGVRPRERAAALLARPMSPERVLTWAGREVTAEQITARLAEANA